MTTTTISINGWLCPNGTFIQCGFDAHDELANWHGYDSLAAMKRDGYIMFVDGHASATEKPTPQQISYLQNITDHTLKGTTK